MATTITITCPHCGLAREVPKERIPAGSVRVTCPQCRESFMFAKPGESPQRPATQSNAAAPPPAGWGTTKTAAPHPRPVPPDPIRALLRKKNLSTIGTLFSNSWTIYKRRVWTLLGLDLIVLIPTLLLFGAIFLIHLLFPDLRTVTPLLAGVIIAGLIAVLIASLWGQTALVFAVTDDALTIREALERGWHRLGSFAWLSLLLGFIVMGGFWLLIVPGLIFLVWFFFGQFFLAGDDERGMNALLKSKAYVKGHFFAVLLRLFVVWLMGVALGMVPFIGPILSALFVPYAMIFAFLVYRELREIKGDISFPSSAGEKFKWIGAGLLGYAVIPVILFAFLGTALLTLFSFEKALFKPLDDYGKAVMTAPPGKPPEMPLLLKMAAEVNDKTPVPTTAAQYDALLASQKVDFESGTKVSVGPAAFLLDHFWDDAKSPHVWLKVRVTPLPNLELDSHKFTRLVVEHVRDRDNRDIYEPANTFETEFFQRLNLSRHDDPPPRLEAIRDVHLQSGARESDIAAIEGTLQLNLPEQIETLAFDESMKGKEVAGAGATVTLKEMSGEKVSLEYRGDFARHIKTVGYGKDGKPLAGRGSSANTQGDLTTYNPEFQGEVHSVKVIVATGFAERKFPFTLKR